MSCTICKAPEVRWDFGFSKLCETCARRVAQLPDDSVTDPGLEGEVKRMLLQLVRRTVEEGRDDPGESKTCAACGCTWSGGFSGEAECPSCCSVCYGAEIDCPACGPKEDND